MKPLMNGLLHELIAKVMPAKFGAFFYWHNLMIYIDICFYAIFLCEFN